MVKHVFEVVGKTTKVATGLAPASRAAGTFSTASVNRFGFSGCLVYVQSGTASGSPTAVSVSVKLQHSDDGTSSWSDFSSDTEVVSAVNSNGVVEFDLLGAKKFVRAVVTVSFTGGTNPELNSSCLVVLSGTSKVPV